MPAKAEIVKKEVQIRQERGSDTWEESSRAALPVEQRGRIVNK